LDNFAPIASLSESVNQSINQSINPSIKKEEEEEEEEGEKEAFSSCAPRLGEIKIIQRPTFLGNI